MSSSSDTRLALALGAVAVLAIPVAVAVAAYSPAVDLLQAVYVGVPAAFVAGLAAWSAYRRARAKLDRRVRRRGERLVRAARFLAFTGIYFALTGAIALGFYGLLQLSSS